MNFMTNGGMASYSALTTVPHDASPLVRVGSDQPEWRLTLRFGLGSQCRSVLASWY